MYRKDFYTNLNLWPGDVDLGKLPNWGGGGGGGGGGGMTIDFKSQNPEFRINPGKLHSCILYQGSYMQV